MFQFIIGLAFLIILLIPISFFMFGLIYSTGEEMRKSTQRASNRQKEVVVKTKQAPKRERMRIVK